MSQPQPTERPRRGWVTKHITVPANLAQACREFNSGKYYECHETLEEIWQEEEGDVRDLYKGLIQVAAAFVHITRGNDRGARRLLSTGASYLEPYRSETTLGMNVDEICRAAAAALAVVESDGSLAVPADPARVPVYRFDPTSLAAQAIHWRAWGFDREGTPLTMPIQVPDEG